MQIENKIRDHKLQIEALSSVNGDLKEVKVELQEVYLLEFKEYTML